ncbi:exonuclease V-like protein [Rhynchospora pubera]|uniref:Exonuclease V-like protein n=1 Tax=Rhynchospora pubera TaxID=906938 RepID=A0AAV8F5I1_9POAL|nr:exonuclease V-like protein [Rhynchospora pubera]
METSATNNTIPVEIISEEEMAFLEAALASARPLIAASFSSSINQCRSVSLVPRATPPDTPDIEESGVRLPRKPFLAQFRKNRGLTVTDITATEWCEKQMEFVLLHGRPRRTKAMKMGSDRHAQLEKEVIERVEIRVKSAEESWAMKFINFIAGSNQLIFEGLTRELPVIGLFNGIWLVGVIDELRVPTNERTINPILVDTKTRSKPTLPAEPQKRNARFQLMCYKYLWDDLIYSMFPSDEFFKYFNLDSQYVLSDEIKEYVNSMGFQAKTLGEVMTYYKNTCSLLPRSKDELLLRYELQADNTLLEEYVFSYDASWFQTQMKQCLDFWVGNKEVKYVTEDEKWKCQYCKFSSICPLTTVRASSSQN